MTESPTELRELNQWMHAHHLHGYWTQEGGGPGAQRKPRLWRWADIYPGLLQAGALLPAQPSGAAGPRTIELRDPDGRGIPRAISLSAQILMPGERTATRRSPTNEALFVVEASPGAFVVAEGEAMPIEAGDMVVIPAGVSCSHRNAGKEPSVWLAAQDAGLVGFMGADTGDLAPTDPLRWTDKPAGYFAAIQIRMRAPDDASSPRRPPVRYPWTETFATLSALARGDERVQGPEGIHLRYTSPVDGGATLAAFSCEIQLLAPGSRTQAHRHNSTTIYAVARGHGVTDVAGERMEWAQGDVFSVPPWSWHFHQSSGQNSGAADAVLFSIDDWPAMRSMGFYRTEVGGLSAVRRV